MSLVYRWAQQTFKSVCITGDGNVRIQFRNEDGEAGIVPISVDKRGSHDVLRLSIPTSILEDRIQPHPYRNDLRIIVNEGGIWHPLQYNRILDVYTLYVLQDTSNAGRDMIATVKGALTGIPYSYWRESDDEDNMALE
jgi:hypothetical protein